MNGKKDIDPQSELEEREDEPTLPEIEEEPDLTKTGTLAAGRSAIVRAAKHAPKGPGVYRMIDSKGDVRYVGKDGRKIGLLVAAPCDPPAPATPETPSPAESDATGSTAAPTSPPPASPKPKRSK